MATLSSEAQLRQLVSSRLPAVNTAGCRFSPIQGLTGTSWLIEGAGICLLARQQMQDKYALGVSRRREGRVLKRCGAGIGPQIWLQTPGWLIVEWLVGENVKEASFLALNESGELATLLAELHQRPLSGYRLNLQQQLADYWQHIDRRRITPAWLRWQRTFMQNSPPQPLKLAPLHMDVHAGNLLVQGERLRLIDWEYAADGDIALELAALFRFNQLSTIDQQHFLHHYAQRGYADRWQLVAQVQRWLPWVDYLMLMWFEVRWQQTGELEFLRWSAALYRRFCLLSPRSQ
ncbi:MULTISPECIES: thiamine kinase [unclassified Serratia (in: enterobacteria)]|uniref:thiamine kinase n=1 Tax=unclassified Serratia (in: enterobacteria) TaxID=2647522 RepID=UPI0005022780|nr:MULTISPECIES: thiamine kinase [unclassified Serratia (in: enterobacteria)]KFK96496.1 thiamine kinase [Serratia sp. Ag2]KFK99971.1 thiamine kinase [Serratia sp. Ag1]